MNELVLIYITNPTNRDAKNLARHLLEKRLIACGNIFPIDSLYRWEGRITAEKEFVLIAKTSKSNFRKVKAEVEKVHPYSIPCVIKIPASANAKYFRWLKGNL